MSPCSKALTTLAVEDAPHAVEVVRLLLPALAHRGGLPNLKKDGLELEESQVQQAEHLFLLPPWSSPPPCASSSWL